MRYSKVNKAISDFKKVSNNINLIAELMLFYAEVGIDLTNEYGDIDDQFYYAIERAYLIALEYIFKNNLQEQYKDN
ncbi:hypothetical protein GOM49_14355 [Clostridium bovifaecis]|uniref:Uncharacterized protein n=1 Tax=Clostridium bovifaecis TaxID=2184719 RepID=A0A6I6F6L7_9CLOT|nr:hypothetical protein GOM49_14355 [Clostridium bovifaecis]